MKFSVIVPAYDSSITIAQWLREAGCKWTQMGTQSTYAECAKKELFRNESTAGLDRLTKMLAGLPILKIGFSVHTDRSDHQPVRKRCQIAERKKLLTTLSKKELMATY